MASLGAGSSPELLSEVKSAAVPAPAPQPVPVSATDAKEKRAASRNASSTAHCKFANRDGKEVYLDYAYPIKITS